jgi:hypothetical protein
VDRLAATAPWADMMPVDEVEDRFRAGAESDLRLGEGLVHRVVLAWNALHLLHRA